MSSRKLENRQDKLELPPISTPSRSILLFVICLAGLIISLISGFRENIPFLKSLCSSACTDTAEVHFLHVPFWLLGVIFYSTAAILAMFRREVVLWIAGPVAGVEAVLIMVMVQLKAPCTYCIANAVVILLLFVAAFRRKLFWQQTALALLFFIAFFFWVPFENGLSRSAVNSGSNHRTGGESSADESGIAAAVGDEVITNQRLDVLLGPKLLETKRDIYRMKMEKLDQLIIEIVLNKEAKQQGKTIENLIDQIVPVGSVQVEESEIDKYIQENQERLQPLQANNLPDFRMRIKAFLEQQRRGQAIRDYAHGLEPKYDVHVFVSLPYPPKIKVDTTGCPAVGPPDAPVTIVEFSDYQCPACRSTHQVVKQVREAYGDKVQWIYKEYPLMRHKEAFKAAEASHCADDQGKFWQYQDSLFTSPDLSPENLVNMAVQLGMSQEKFSHCLQDSKYKTLVEKNQKDAVQAGVDRTPTFMINGTLTVGGPTLENFRGLIDEELKKAQPHSQNLGKAQ